MTVEFFNQDDERIAPGGEPLFRGATMAIYRDGRWHRQAKRRGDFPVPPSIARGAEPDHPADQARAAR